MIEHFDSRHLVFDGKTDAAPCFYTPKDTSDAAAAAAAAALEAVPDSNLVAPSNIPGNDQRSLELLAKMMAVRPLPLPNSTCTANPAGYACTPSHSVPGQLVTCVPRMDHSDLNQLSAKVLPLSVSRGHGPLDDPARGDARFEIYPKKYLPAFSRCCFKNGRNVLSDPTDVIPMNCDVPKAVSDRLVAAQSHVLASAKNLGFRNNSIQLQQLGLTHSQLKKEAELVQPTIAARDKVWEHEAAQIVPGLMARLKMMSVPHAFVLSRRKEYFDFI